MFNHSPQHVHSPVNPQLRVDVSRQVMDLLDGASVVKSYPVSTSKFGLGTEPGSFKTPLGRFRVCEKIGDQAPLRAVFKSRVSTGETSELGGEEDRILSRILWLEGLEEANANTRDRYIYIHGTNQESLIGTPASHGCIRMLNADIAELFGQIPDGTIIEIVA